MSLKKKQAISGESFKPDLIYKTYNSLNSRPIFNQETSLSTNLILSDKIIKIINLKNLQNHKKK